MKRLTRQLALAAVVLVVFVASFALLSYSGWVRGIERGNAALARQDYTAAEQAFTSAEKRVGNAADYQLSIFNHARLLDAVHRYDDLSHLLEAAVAHQPALGESSEYHYWLGIVEYRKALAVSDKQAQRSGLQRASESFRLALAAAPEDWDARYNYELTARLLDSMRKKDDAPDKVNRGGMKILREDPDKEKDQKQKLAPVKQSRLAMRHGTAA